MSALDKSAAEQAKGLIPFLSKNASVLTDPTTDTFKRSMERWSDHNVLTPSAIIKPACEEDIIRIVKHAVQHKIPFVARCGGRSSWSTTGPGGWIIDMSLQSSISLDIQNKTATVAPGVITKQLIEAVAKEGMCIQTASASSVGYIPFLLGGGTTWMTGMHGLAVDNLVSARVVTATQGLVVASATENADLFWALKGAGQFFGIVTSVTVRMFPFERPITTWTIIFLPKQINEVASALAGLANGPNIERSPGMAAIMAAPGQTNPLILVNTMHFRPEEEADEIVAPLLALQPTQKIKKAIGFANITDASQAINEPGGFKAQISCGMQKFDAQKFKECLKSFTNLVEEHPSASGSFLMTSWYSTKAMRQLPDDSSSYSHRDCGVWNMAFVISQDENAATAAIRSAQEYLKICQEDQTDSEKAVFPNHTRERSLEQRYRGEGRMIRLRQLKKLWDPEGIFTDHFL
ncbi:hypothetical protein B0O99DRAFT_687431 [Bisporella sp. PMI_857]|nr:hypothetical protein B0O99DRAFT_687431 [Bisporella sp. PMI_857]